MTVDERENGVLDGSQVPYVLGAAASHEYVQREILAEPLEDAAD